MHSLLRRQLDRLGLDPDSPPDAATWAAFLERVAASYEDADRGRALVERSMEISSREMRELHGRLREANADLEARVRARTDELERVNTTLQDEVEQRRRAEQVAEEASRVKSEFMARMSHELRTPMNGVLGMTELLLLSELSREQRPLVETIYESGEAMRSLVDHLLDFAGIEERALVLRPTPFELRRLLDDVVDGVRPVARERGLALDVAAGDDLPGTVVADRERVRLVLLNLVGNAVKFTPSGSVEVRAERLATQSDRGGPDTHATIRFTVSDTGIGIGQTELHSIFLPFTQVDGGTRRRFGGIGIGLTIVQTLVELMHGTIEASSEPGVGSTFRVTIPMEVAPAAAPEERVSSEPHTVLLASANPVVREIALAMLGSLNCTVTQADVVGAAAAVREHAADPFDLVVVDDTAPASGALDATRRIRADEAISGRSRTPVVGLTIAPGAGERTLALDAGLDELLEMPLSRGRLAAALLRWAPNGPARQASGA